MEDVSLKKQENDIIMSAFEEIEKLKLQFVSLNTEEELKEFDKKMRDIYNSKTEEEKEKFARAFEESANKSLEHAEQVYNAVNRRFVFV
jgi:ABC-type hemin transport system substrate-binding protein